MPKGFGEVQSLENFLQEKYNKEKAQEKYLVLKEVQDFIEEPKVKTLLLLMSQRRLYAQKYDTTIIIVSSVLRVPQEIDKYVSYLEMDFPNEEEINRLIDEHIEVNFYDKSKFKEEDREKLITVCLLFHYYIIWGNIFTIRGFCLHLRANKFRLSENGRYEIRRYCFCRYLAGI